MVCIAPPVLYVPFAVEKEKPAGKSESGYKEWRSSEDAHSNTYWHAKLPHAG